VACTQICLYASTTEDNAEATAAVVKDAAFTKENEPIRGLRSLRSKDRDVVLAHMRKNAELGLLDERRELSEDQYTRKTRVVEKEPSPYLTATLLPYQREALAWMTAQEKSDYRGGILADEMGMGKTLQAIALIIENPRIDDEPVPESNVTKASKARSQKAGFSKTTVRGGTLVVCPLVAVTQWKSEIERFVEANRLSIYIHHGPKRHDLVEKIAAYDIVLTTYSIIESEARKTLGWEKVPCKYCKKKYLPDKLILHNKYFCGPNAKKTMLQDRQQTKKPKKRAAGEEDDTDSDEDDLKKPVKGKKSKKPVRKNQKKKKGADSEEEDDDLDDSPQRKQKGKSPMHQIHWTRIVLDEAHYIKDRRCNTARGVFELKSDFKWCLTGTACRWC
jgi:DNA repair protein RAD16